MYHLLATFSQHLFIITTCSVSLLLTNPNSLFCQRLYNYGARKFVFAGIGPIGCIPAQRIKNQTEECNEESNSMAVEYNNGLKTMLQELKSELNGLSYSYFDTYSMLQNIVQKPATYGIYSITCYVPLINNPINFILTMQIIVFLLQGLLRLKLLVVGLGN